jgi:hypothetical protein
MPHVIEKTVFKFEELSDRAKEKAREWWRSCEAEDFDASCTCEDAATIAEILGIDLRTRAAQLLGGGTRYEPCIWYSGFYSQGNGACFEGSYSYAKGAAKRIRAHAPQDSELRRIADELQDLQRRAFYRLSARMAQRGYGYHSGCMTVDVDLSEGDATREQEEALTQLMRDFADWIYAQLRSQYEYVMSDENVNESIKINEYEFDEDGNVA